MILTGTSGYSYDDWKGIFYPENLKKEDFLRYYSSQFEAVELNFTYYRMPTEAIIESMLEKTEGQVTFAVRAHRTMTHERTAARKEIEEFTRALAPLKQAGRLGATLLQFPQSFHQREQNRYYLKKMVDAVDFPVVEFRSRQWSTPAIFDWLKKNTAGLCCVDEPNLKGLMPPVTVVTSKTAYVRFHGRNAAQWYRHNHPHERYNYLYSESELAKWIPRIIQMDKASEKTLVFFNNHFEAKAAQNAKGLTSMLKKQEQ